MEKTVLVTGAAGFIGAKTSEKLLEKGYTVVGLDNLNDYYDIELKNYRLDLLKGIANFTFIKEDIEQLSNIRSLFKQHHFCAVINLAARAGVRASVTNPFIYMSTNAQGTLNLLECCKENNVRDFVLASTSSLYAGQNMPFEEVLPVNEPISPYAASKKAAEAICYTYHYLYGMNVTILRYFL